MTVPRLSTAIPVDLRTWLQCDGWLCRSGGAVPAGAKDGEVVEVCFEPGVFLQCIAQLGEMGFVEGIYLAALPADQMMVPLFARPLEQRVAGAEVGLTDEAQVLRRREGAINSRSIDVGITATCLFE